MVLTTHDNALLKKINELSISEVVEQLQKEGIDPTDILNIILKEIEASINYTPQKKTWTSTDKARLLVAGSMTEPEYKEALKEIQEMGLNPKDYECFKPKSFKDNQCESISDLRDNQICSD